MFRFLHTADWQLGMTRRFLDGDAQARYTQARFDAVRELLRVAAAESCACVVVCGDVFESNQVDRRTVRRALDALASTSLPVYLLPGNHDPLDDASIYRSAAFLHARPPHVHVIETSAPLAVVPGVELIGGPWLAKRAPDNPLDAALAALSPAPGVLRVAVGHGGVDRFSPDRLEAGMLSVAALEQAVADGWVDAVVLGDRHSLTPLDAAGRIAYSGTPEATDFDETRSGFARLVELGPRHFAARDIAVGRWRFWAPEWVDCNGDDDIRVLADTLAALDHKDRTVARLRLAGTLTLAERARLDHILADAADRFAAVDVIENDLAVVAADDDFADLGLSGFADTTVTTLRERAAAGGPEAKTAADALRLLVRLATEGAP